MTHPVCMVLGADSDIGRTIACRFGKERFDLYLTTRSLDRIDQDWSSKLKDDYRIKISWFHFEGLEFDSHMNFYQHLPQPPEVVICVFGYLGDQKKAEVDFTEALKITQSNYTSQVSILNIVAEDMEHRKKGVIIGVSSVAGDRGRKANYLYGSAKGAFTIYLSGLRNRLHKSGVHVITIKPGYIRTKMTQHLTTPRWLTARPGQLAEKVFDAYLRKTNTVYYFSRWRWIMWLIKGIPETLFKRLNL
ncbi:MAG: SDR family oxidoreductase [Saprospiraceae bacterium]|nr:SDR family oxidoreductase [Saprospiraceae bacterium]